MICRNSEILRRELFNSMEQLNDMILHLTKRAMLQVLKINSILVFFYFGPPFASIVLRPAKPSLPL